MAGPDAALSPPDATWRRTHMKSRPACRPTGLDHGARSDGRSLFFFVLPRGAPLILLLLLLVLVLARVVLILPRVLRILVLGTHGANPRFTASLPLCKHPHAAFKCRGSMWMHAPHG